MTKEQKFLLLVVLIVIGAGAVYYVQTNKVAAPAPVVNAPVVAPVSVAKSYSSNIDYKVPGDKTETIHVTISLKDGVIEDVAFSSQVPDNEISALNIKNFNDALKNITLKGKKLSEVSIVRVGGSSLTSDAFVQALADINTQSNG